MPDVRLNVAASGGLATLSTAYPDDEFTLLTSGSTADGHVTLLEAPGLDPDIVREHLEADPDVDFVDVIHTGERRTVVQFLYQPEPAPGRASRESATPPPFPMRIRDGWVRTEATTTHDQLARYTDELDAAGVAYELVSITQSTDPGELLTDRQHQFVTAAIGRGYYDSPRRCSLTELADDFGVNKATASGVLHRAEGVILKEFMGEPT